MYLPISTHIRTALIAMLALSGGIGKAQVPATDPQLVKTLKSEEELEKWRPGLLTFAEFTAAVSASKPMSTMVVGDFYFGWRIDASSKSERRFIWCDEEYQKPSAQWSTFGIVLSFIDASGNCIQHVNPKRGDEHFPFRVLQAEFNRPPNYRSWSNFTLMASGRVLPPTPPGTIGLLCEMSGTRLLEKSKQAGHSDSENLKMFDENLRKNGIRSSGYLFIPLDHLTGPSPAGH